MKFSKLKLGFYEFASMGMIIGAALLRSILIAQGWPLTNSDEGTIGIMALHIAYRGDHPVFYYGQNYMGSLEAYLGAMLFHLFGPSLFVLRLGLLLMFVLFLACMYILTVLVYSKAMGLLTLLLLGLGSSFVMARELSAIGGYPETLLFGSLMFLFAAWLVLSYQSTDGPGRMRRVWRYVAYIAWGLSAGLGLWSDLLTAPFALLSGLLLVGFCWREMVCGVALLCLLLGLVGGAYPLLYYNFQAQPGYNSLQTLALLANSGSTRFVHTWAIILGELKGTIMVSIPSMTGNPFCPVTEVAILGPSSPHSLHCTIIHATWGIGYVLLFAAALLLTLAMLWQTRIKHRSEAGEPFATATTTTYFRRHVVALALLMSALLSLMIYTFSAAPVTWPGIHARYIIGVLIATPVVIYPLWLGLSRIRVRWLRAGSASEQVVDSQDQNGHPGRWQGIVKYTCGAIFVSIVIVLMIGTIRAFEELPGVRQSNQQEDVLIKDLVHLHITHIYSDYWTCDKIAFISNEQIVCGVIDGHLHPSHNRYMPYYTMVSADPRSAYAYPLDSSYVVTHSSNPPSSAESVLLRGNTHYRRYILDGYVIYQPVRG